MKKLNLGIIGLSEGNGHPYSWSAIFNGYNPELMENCGFPVIPRYLEQHRFPEETIKEARVSHVWTQESSLSAHIAKTTGINKVVSNYADMIGHVDGVLLARDDAVNHLSMALPFLDAGLPIYIDKPLALSSNDAEVLISSQQYPGQLFSCSALLYADELKISKADYSSLGKIRQIQATVPKDWDKYAIHVIDPVLSMIPNRGKLLNTVNSIHSDLTTLVAAYENDLVIIISSCGNSKCPISIRVIGENGSKEYVFEDSFRAFKNTLKEFTLGILNQDMRTDPHLLTEAVSLIEAGRNE